MESLVMAGLGSLLGASSLLVVQSLRGIRVYPNFAEKSKDALQTAQRSTAWILIALIGAALVFALTRWPVAAGWCAVGILAYGGSRGRRITADEVARVEAVATWAEQIRDTIASAAGLQQALIATAEQPPLPLRNELRTFAARVGRLDLATSLRMLGQDLAHPSADLVIAGLTQAARLDAGNMGPLLSRLAVSIREDARMRVRVEVSRARIRTSSRIVTVFMLLTSGILVLAGRGLLSGYATPTGQLWLVLVGAVVAASIWTSALLAAIPVPERFVARRTT